MGRIWKGRPSAAIAVVRLVFVAAAVGTAVAGPSAESSAKKLNKAQKKQVKSLAKKQANKQIAKKESGLNVNSAKTAGAAQTASTANGVRPVKVNYAADYFTGFFPLLDEGGLKVSASCGVGSAVVRVKFESTAADGALHVTLGGTGGIDTARSDEDFDPPDQEDFSTSGTVQAHVTYRGAGGNAVTGELIASEGAGADDCIVGGTLLVG